MIQSPAEPAGSLRTNSANVLRLWELEQNAQVTLKLGFVVHVEVEDPFELQGDR